MIKILMVVGLGVLVGMSGVVKGKGLKANGYIQSMWLLLLIFAMGVGIGNNEEVTQNIGRLGGEALIYALFCVVGSVVVVYVLSKLFLEKREKK